MIMSEFDMIRNRFSHFFSSSTFRDDSTEYQNSLKGFFAVKDHILKEIHNEKKIKALKLFICPRFFYFTFPAKNLEIFDRVQIKNCCKVTNHVKGKSSRPKFWV